jgi:hypothetical protein
MSTFVEFLETLDYKLNVPIIRKIGAWTIERDTTAKSRF